MARKMADRDEKGKFIEAPTTPEEIRASFEAFNDVIDVKKELKKLHLMSMKYLRGTIKLDNAQAKLLNDMYKILTDKLAPNAKGGETGPSELDVVIKPPKKSS
jgi:hypothetical protein